MGTYSRGTYATYGDLPVDDSDLTVTMSAGEISDVATINNVFVGQNLSNQVAAMQFKNTCSASLANLVFVGQGDLAPSISPITLEAYNYSTAAWVGQATNAAAATNATCTLGVTLGTTQYISPGGYTTGRVYQNSVLPIEYFGNNSEPATGLDNLDGAYFYSQTFQCPGSGTRTVLSIEGWIYGDGGTGQHVRMALYDDGVAPNRICEWSAEIAITNTSSAWIGGSQALSPAAPTITGGNYYRICLTADGADPRYHLDAISNGTRILSVDYTGGWPASLPNEGSWVTELPGIRVKVQ